MCGEWLAGYTIHLLRGAERLGRAPAMLTVVKDNTGVALACWESQVYKHGELGPAGQTEITRSSNVYSKVGQGELVNESLGIYLSKKSPRSRMTQFGRISGAKFGQIKSQTFVAKKVKTLEL